MAKASKQEFQMPLLPDPGKADDDNQQTFDFSIRLGSTLARGFENESGKVKRDWTQKPRRKDGFQVLDIRAARKVSSVTPRSTTDGEQTARNGAKTSRSRRESRRTSNINRQTSTYTNPYISGAETVNELLLSCYHVAFIFFKT